MITREMYLQDPCGSLSIPYWKWQRMTVPDTLQILHHREFIPGGEFHEEAYFRLKHDLGHIPDCEADGYTVRQAKPEEIPLFVQIINASYRNLTVTERTLLDLTAAPVYDPALWLVAQSTRGESAGCIICDLDRENREGVLEWVQVLPQYRRMGIGQLLVTEALRRMTGKADFATVSGNCANLSNPEGLYRKCGFQGSDIWHILQKV